MLYEVKILINDQIVARGSSRVSFLHALKIAQAKYETLIKLL